MEWKEYIKKCIIFFILSIIRSESNCRNKLVRITNNIKIRRQFMDNTVLIQIKNENYVEYYVSHVYGTKLPSKHKSSQQFYKM